MVPEHPLRIGVLGGSFDPVHLGHLHVAQALKKYCRLDEVWFTPAYQNPHKKDRPMASVSDRLEMLYLATEGESSFKVVDIECKRKGPSYTIDTLKQLKELHPHSDFYLVLGFDAVKQFHRWKSPYEILSLCTLVVVARDQEDVSLDYEDVELEKRVREAIAPFPLFPASSTVIRKLACEGKSLHQLLPLPVARYIEAHGLYA